jgi:hypothetical protein
MRTLKSALLPVTCLLLLVCPARAQSQATTADLLGTVRDQTQAVMPGATVTAVSTETGLERSALSDDSGNYRILLLPPGTYEVKAEMPGFATKVTQGIRLTVGQYAQLNIQLDISPTETEVFVSSNAQIVESEKTVQASTIEQSQIENLPINGRNYLEFILLTPGTTDANTLVNFSAPQTPASGLSFGGQDLRSNNLTIDGADNMDAVSGGVRATLSQEAIQEFQVTRNSYAAEFGRARGGVVNIVSKSGTNNFHGNAFFYFRNNSLDARNTFSKIDDPPFSRYQFGGTLGGPIVKDKTFFFTSFERLDREESNFVTFLDDPSIFQPTGSQLDLFGFLGSTGIPPLQLMSAAFINPQFGVLYTNENTFPDTVERFEAESGIFPFQADQTTFSFKLDHQFAENNNFFARVNYTDSFDEGAKFGALQGVSNGLAFAIDDFSLVLSDTQIFSPTTLNDFRFQYSQREFEALTNDPVGPELIIGGVAQFGREFFNPTGYNQDLFQFTNNATFIRGNHTLKAGVDLNTMKLAGFAKVFLGGQFSFGEAISLALIMDSALGPGTAENLIQLLATPPGNGGLGRPDLIPNVLEPITSTQSFNFGLPITYFQGFGDPNIDINYTQLALFFQDHWKIRNNFTLDLGIRYDTDWRPETANIISAEPPFEFSMESINDRNNISPRLGFAWNPGGDQKMVIRGGYGIFYQSVFQATAFVSQVLAGQIEQVFLPLTGLPGIDATSATVYGVYKSTGELNEDTLELVGVAPGTTPSVILPSAGNIVTPWSQQVSFGIERQLASDWVLSADYILNRGTNLIRSRDINVRQVGDNEFELPGLDERFVQVNQIETSGSSTYHGLTVKLRKRFAQDFSLMAAYTLGKAVDDTTDFISQLQANNQKDLRSEKSLSAFDQRQRFVISGVYQSPWSVSGSDGFVHNLFADWTFAPIITISSGRPFNLLLGYDLNGDTHEETDRPVLALEGSPIVGRNTGRGPAFSSVDIRLSRRVMFGEQTNFEFVFEAFNLFNNVNYSGINNVFGTTVLTTGDVEGSSDIPSNQPLGFTSAFAPRQIQFGFRFNF